MTINPTEEQDGQCSESATKLPSASLNVKPFKK